MGLLSMKVSDTDGGQTAVGYRSKVKAKAGQAGPVHDVGKTAQQRLMWEGLLAQRKSEGDFVGNRQTCSSLESRTTAGGTALPSSGRRGLSSLCGLRFE